VNRGRISTFMASNRNDREIATKAAQQSRSLSSLSSAYLGSASRRGFVLGFGNTKANDVARAARHLKRVIER
jgi:DNA-binding transcriptional MocR family regulator